MQTILLQYQLEFVIQNGDSVEMDSRKEEERLKAQLGNKGDIVDINLDAFPKRFVVTFSSKKDTQALLSESMR